MSRVSGKVAIITGAASGLGYAAAVKLMNEGAKVMLSDINEDVINTMPERLKEFSQKDLPLMHALIDAICNNKKFTIKW